MRGAQLPEPCFLTLRRFERCAETILCTPPIGRRCGQQYLAFYPLGFGSPPAFAGSLDLPDRLIREIDCPLIIAGVGMGVRKARQVE